MTPLLSSEVFMGCSAATLISAMGVGKKGAKAIHEYIMEKKAKKSSTE